MTSHDEQKSTKKRVGRKRLPPLAPGPALQFVVASHPDDFKADDTMRNIRSHVMYKHRGESRESLSPGERPSSVGARSSRKPCTRTHPIRTPSPMATTSQSHLDHRWDADFLSPWTTPHNAFWDGEYSRLSPTHIGESVRNLATRIISASTAESRSAPPMFQQGSEYPFPGTGSIFLGGESLEELRGLYVDDNEICQDRAWMEIICSTRMSFLSSVSANCVYQDVSEGCLDDSPLTVYAKTKVLQMIKESLETGPSTDDYTVLSILHLLISEVGGFDEEVFNVHLEGLFRIIQQRGGLRNLGMDGRVATFLTTVILTFTILRNQPEPALLHGFFPSPAHTHSPLVTQSPPISPLYAPNDTLSSLYGSVSDGTYEILEDMLDLTRTFFLRHQPYIDTYTSQVPLTCSDLASYDIHMQQIYRRLLGRPPTGPGTPPNMTQDWIYEAVRLAALIYTRSIVQGVPFSESENVPHAVGSGSSGQASMQSQISFLEALHAAVERTDTRGCWGELWGVFLWVCFVGGAASWKSDCHGRGGCFGFEERDGFEARDGFEGRNGRDLKMAWWRKCFSVWAVRACLRGGDEYVGETALAQRCMVGVLGVVGRGGGRG